MTDHYGNSRASSSSASSLNSSSQGTEDDHAIAKILAEEEEIASRYEGKLGKRLSHLDSIPHTPRIIGQIPDPNDATLDHGRLSGRLAAYGLAEFQIQGDGNCQFRALADQLYHNPEYHKHVRKEVVKQIIFVLGRGSIENNLSTSPLRNLVKNSAAIISNNGSLDWITVQRHAVDKQLVLEQLSLKHFRKFYESYVPMKYKSYLKKMKRLGEWGDHITLQAAADRYGVKVCLVTSFRENGYIEILPKDIHPSRELWLSFWSEVHYNSLYEIGEVPARVRRKKHWLF